MENQINAFPIALAPWVAFWVAFWAVVGVVFLFYKIFPKRDTPKPSHGVPHASSNIPGSPDKFNTDHPEGMQLVLLMRLGKSPMWMNYGIEHLYCCRTNGQAVVFMVPMGKDAVMFHDDNNLYPSDA